MATKLGRRTLLEKALELPLAQQSDFFDTARYPAGVNPQQLRIIKDTALRSRLIAAGLAEGLQSPKGPQKIASILRIYPDGNAPDPSRPRAAAARHEPARAAFGLPTVEELHSLLSRLETEERDAAVDLQGKVNEVIARLKREIGHLDGEAFERAFAELDRALQARRDVAGQIREEAFRRIESDGAFEPRKYLRLISRDIRTN